jgi:VWFA-related protein
MSTTRNAHRFRFLISIFAFSFLSANARVVPNVPAPYPDQATDQEQGWRPNPLQNEVTVTLKLLQVMVTDKQGNPVNGLRGDEFVVYDNDKLQTVSEFERHELRVPTKAGTEERLAETPLPRPGLLNRKLFLFFDFTYTDPQGARKAAETALKFIDGGLLPTDEVAVFSCSGMRSIRVHQNLTPDHALVRKAVLAFGLAGAQKSPVSPEDAYQQRLKDGGAADARPEAETSYKSASAREAAVYNLVHEERWLARNFVWALNTLAQALRYLPGRKSLILFSGGVPGRIINKEPPSKGNPAGPWVTVPKEDMNMDLRNDYTRLCRALATSNVAVFPVNTDPLSAASEMKSGAATLRELAATTGGRYFGNIQNADRHMETIQTLTASYYVVGYPIAASWDGKYHRIRIEVTRPGCTVRTQAGYFNPKPFADYTELEKRIDLVDLALAATPLSQVPVRFAMQAQAAGPAPSDGLFLAAAVTPQELAEVAGPWIDVNNLIFNAADDIVASGQSKIRLESIGDDPVYFVSVLSVPAGSYQCRIVLRNAETGRAAVAGTSATVTEPRADGLTLHAPLLLLPRKKPFYAGNGAAKASAFFDPSRFAPVVGQSLESGSAVAAAVRCSGPAAMMKDLSFKAFLIDSITGDQIPVGLSVAAEKTGRGYKAFLLELVLQEVEPDSYRFYIQATDAGSGSASHVARDFEIQRKKDAR